MGLGGVGDMYTYTTNTHTHTHIRYAGKSTLLRFLAQYKLPELQHLRILLVDQHVEGGMFVYVCVIL
ncbi:hypothetical protein EON63_24010 [archaeon]|nr:MAG: hypothetical protein EON63_24010 [archaeon]